MSMSRLLKTDCALKVSKLSGARCEFLGWKHDESPIVAQLPASFEMIQALMRERVVAGMADYLLLVGVAASAMLGILDIKAAMTIQM